jgi:hypothetical protein
MAPQVSQFVHLHQGVFRDGDHGAGYRADPWDGLRLCPLERRDPRPMFHEKQSDQIAGDYPTQLDAAVKMLLDQGLAVDIDIYTGSDFKKRLATDDRYCWYCVEAKLATSGDGAGSRPGSSVGVGGTGTFP